ncbi:hypothetical protein Sango_2455300 [Sesamum angolense]|uniref:DUF3444 domain-containing protein n=1 Tax=Sesamum angolense TaxID=2727404 RepID=A0AAE2BK81_9LAMI|nr:hypothetical protein Sango_2455300 [Sesamum angolense]
MFPAWTNMGCLRYTQRHAKILRPDQHRYIRRFQAAHHWLEPHPDDDEETRWLFQGLPASCGKFRLGDSETIDAHEIFSHIVSWKKRISLRNMYEVYPRKGETWAVFKNWDIGWYRNPESHKAYEFELVEILTDYCCGVGVHVGFLGKIEGFSSIFSRKNSQGMDWGVVLVKERLRFSHRVPSFQMTSNEGLHGIKSFFELDPASL